MNQLDRYNKPSVVMFKNMKFFIMDSPSKSNIDMYVKELLNNDVKKKRSNKEVLLF